MSGDGMGIDKQQEAKNYRHAPRVHKKYSPILHCASAQALVDSERRDLCL